MENLLKATSQWFLNFYFLFRFSLFWKYATMRGRERKCEEEKVKWKEKWEKDEDYGREGRNSSEEYNGNSWKFEERLRVCLDEAIEKF